MPRTTTPIAEDTDTTEHDPLPIHLSPEESRAEFDRAVRTLMGISGDEFIERWDAGEFDDIADAANHRHILYLAHLIPLGC
jgi:hypothetical protein